MRITKQNRETLLSQLAEAGEEGLPHRRLTGRGTYTATRLLSLDFAWLDRSGEWRPTSRSRDAGRTPTALARPDGQPLPHPQLRHGVTGGLVS